MVLFPFHFFKRIILVKKHKTLLLDRAFFFVQAQKNRHVFKNDMDIAFSCALVFVVILGTNFAALQIEEHDPVFFFIIK
jgi:hypothetical protein